MNIKRISFLFIPFIFGLLPAIVMAQKPVKPAKPVSAILTKNKMPVVKTFLGKFYGITNDCSAEMAKQVLTLPLKIIDNKDVEYKLSSYQFSYKRIGVTEDEETGKVSPQTDIAADRFTVTPLPEIWQSNIKESLHKGEELFFFDVIVFDKKGKLFFAPELKIIIQ